MSRLYGDSQRRLQRAFDTERLADRIEQRLRRERITSDDRAFIERLDMFSLATADAAGRPDCSYKGGTRASRERSTNARRCSRTAHVTFIQ